MRALYPEKLYTIGVFATRAFEEVLLILKGKSD